MPRGKTKGKTPAPAAPAEKPILERLRVQAAQVERALDEAVSEGKSIREVTPLSNSLTKLLKEIARLTGEGEITEAMVMRAPAFERVMVKVEAALRPFPEAAKALAKALADG